MTAETADIIIIGGGVMGSSTAYHLAKRDDFRGKIVVIEADPSYQTGASARSASGIRQQFSSPVNIEISLFGVDFIRNLGDHLEVDGERPDAGLQERGYLFLATADKAHILRENHKEQTKLGADIGYLDKDALSEKFPWLHTEDLAAGCHGLSGEGWFDGYSLLQAFRRKARSLGVAYRTAKASVRKDGSGWKVDLSSGETLSTPVLINTAGASGGAEICRQAGLDVPIHSRKRCVFTFDCREPLQRFPLLIDPTGVYVRSEGSGFLCGSAPPASQDPDCDDFEVDYELFETLIWPTIAARVPAFEAIKPGKAWAGTYDMNLFDYNALVGAVPGIDGYYLALGFSGHGLQQSPAVGRGLSELIVSGRYETLDLSPLGIDRLWSKKPIIEKNVV